MSQYHKALLLIITYFTVILFGCDNHGDSDATITFRISVPSPGDIQVGVVDSPSKLEPYDPPNPAKFRIRRHISGDDSVYGVAVESLEHDTSADWPIAWLLVEHSAESKTHRFRLSSSIPVKIRTDGVSIKIDDVEYHGREVLKPGLYEGYVSEN